MLHAEAEHAVCAHTVWMWGVPGVKLTPAVLHSRLSPGTPNIQTMCARAPAIRRSAPTSRLPILGGEIGDANASDRTANTKQEEQPSSDRNICGNAPNNVQS